MTRDFAANVGIPFHTPEEYFRQEEPRPFVRTFDPTSLVKDRNQDSTPARKLDMICNSRHTAMQALTW